MIWSKIERHGHAEDDQAADQRHIERGAQEFLEPLDPRRRHRTGNNPLIEHQRGLKEDEQRGGDRNDARQDRHVKAPEEFPRQQLSANEQIAAACTVERSARSSVRCLNARSPDIARNMTPRRCGSRRHEEQAEDRRRQLHAMLPRDDFGDDPKSAAMTPAMSSVRPAAPYGGRSRGR